jgi:adenylylsulfate kinase
LNINAKVFWFTGMSGVGKTTLSSYVKNELEKCNYSVLVIDGDDVREKYKTPLGFKKNDVEKNNLFVAKLVRDKSNKYDVIIISIISSIDKVRKKIGKMLSPNFYLIYVWADIKSLKRRDPKGLYKKADEKEITDLIGYSDGNPYDVPLDSDLIIETSENSDLYQCQQRCLKFILDQI